VYDYQARRFKTDELVEQITVHYCYESNIIQKESNAWKIQDDINTHKEDLINEMREKEAQLNSEDPSSHPAQTQY